MTLIKYFVHGTTIDNEAKISSGWTQGELSEVGIRQTKKLAADICNEHFDIVICSDLFRAKQSAKILFGTRNIGIVYDQRLRECNYGMFNGTSHENVVYSEHIEETFPEGESLFDVQKRVENLLKDVRQNYKGKKIAFVAHRAPQLALNVIVHKMTWKEAICTDWRIIGKWQPGWEYAID